MISAVENESRGESNKIKDGSMATLDGDGPATPKYSIETVNYLVKKHLESLGLEALALEFESKVSLKRLREESTSSRFRSCVRKCIKTQNFDPARDFVREHARELAHEKDFVPLFVLPYVDDPLQHPGLSGLLIPENWQASGDEDQELLTILNGSLNTHQDQIKCESAPSRPPSIPDSRPKSGRNRTTRRSPIFDLARLRRSLSSSHNLGQILYSLNHLIFHPRPHFRNRIVVLNYIIENDLLGIREDEGAPYPTRNPLVWAPFVNTIASHSSARAYLSETPNVAISFANKFMSSSAESSHLLSALQKMSLRKNAQLCLARLPGLVAFLFTLLGEAKNQFMLEYGTALLMNITLTKAGRAAAISEIKAGNGEVLVELVEFSEYVLGIWFRVLADVEVRMIARDLGLESRLRSRNETEVAPVIEALLQEGRNTEGDAEDGEDEDESETGDEEFLEIEDDYPSTDVAPNFDASHFLAKYMVASMPLPPSADLRRPQTPKLSKDVGTRKTWAMANQSTGQVHQDNSQGRKASKA